MKELSFYFSFYLVLNVCRIMVSAALRSHHSSTKTDEGRSWRIQGQHWICVITDNICIKCVTLSINIFRCFIHVAFKSPNMDTNKMFFVWVAIDTPAVLYWIFLINYGYSVIAYNLFSKKSISLDMQEMYVNMIGSYMTLGLQELADCMNLTSEWYECRL